MATVLETCTAAMELAGVLAGGETASNTDAQRVFRSLRSMLESWGTERDLIYVTTLEAITPTGATSYTIGESGTPDISSVRPLAITPDSFYRQGSTDYPLYPINRQEYDAIADKSMTGFPLRVFYDPTYPNGTLYFWPIPSDGTVYLNSVKPLATLSLISSTLLYPPGYQRAIEYSLAEEIEGLFDIPIPPSVHKIAAKARYNIKRLNAQDRLMYLPLAVLPRWGYIDITHWGY